jgi:hypothetical protein
MVVPVTPGPTFDPGVARRLLAADVSIVSSNAVPYYDITPDDQRLIVVRQTAVAQTPGGGQMVVVDNWFDELASKMKAR